MKKQTALQLLGGTEVSAAQALGCSRQNVNRWPDELPRRIADRVIAARVRQEWTDSMRRGDAVKVSALIADAIA
jgi:hypothetical protein